MDKSTEEAYDIRIPDHECIVLRLDGHNFSLLTTKYFTKPFDEKFHNLMLKTSIKLVEEFNAIYAYTGSDEISLILPMRYNEFSRRLEKLVSLSDSVASSTFTLASGLPTQFDCRAMTFQQADEAVGYVSSRIADVRRCAIQTLAFWTLRSVGGKSPRRATSLLNRKTWQEKDAMLQKEYGITFADIPLWQQNGVGIEWEIYTKQGFDPTKNIAVTAERRRLVAADITPGEAYKERLRAILTN